jgi:hypothetical protein
LSPSSCLLPAFMMIAGTALAPQTAL